ncbi:MAG: hypothetical protein PHD15_00735 [Clostridia bacterium]|nr:hypothetical protein [Clostridia bacterium]MDD4386276.1 hypothetical protein [Clostridia bacterium]
MKKGISLIVLVITIIVIIILAGAVILSLANNNPINSANKATLLSDVASLKAGVALSYATQFGAANGVLTTLTLDSTSTAIIAKLLSTYGITATVNTTGAGIGTITFTGGTNLPTGVVVTDL